MNKVIFLPKIALAAGISLAIISTISCSSGGCNEPDSNGRIKIGSAISYQTCMDTANNNKRCIGSGIWSYYSNAPDTGDCSCRAEACEDD